MKSVWLPEATDPTEYDSEKPWSERYVDVLELGRKHDLYHAKVAAPLAAARKVHLFEKNKGEIIFPTREAFIEGMAHSKISICFPSSQTHPERSGTVETVTHRYFESMASGCVIVGHAPQELIDLFGYNPVVEVKWGDEFQQLQSLLTEDHFMTDLVERNYERLFETGTWNKRITTMLNLLGATDLRRSEHTSTL